MHKLTQSLFIFCLILIGTFSCGEAEPPVLQLSCTPEQAPDEEAVAAKLLGSWEWKAYGNCGFTAAYSETAEKGVYIRFLEEGVFEEVKDNKVITTGKWQIEKQGENSYYILSEPYHRLLNGQVLFCERELMFSFSYLDGCDQLFVRSSTTED